MNCTSEETSVAPVLTEPAVQRYSPYPALVPTVAIEESPEQSPEQSSGCAPSTVAEPDLKVVEEFFTQYFAALTCMVTGHDLNSWRAGLHPDFVCMDPSGVGTIKGDELLLHQWRSALEQGHYSWPYISGGSLRPAADIGCVDCVVRLARRYMGKTEFLRDLCLFHVTAKLCHDGNLRVLRHNYEALPPFISGGIPARSQISQDLWVVKYFAMLGPRGFFLEVGANHPEELSNTFFLEKACGWKGICIDPFPVGDWSIRCAELVRTAIGPDGGKLKFVAPGHVLGGLVDQVDLPRVIASVPKEQQIYVEVETKRLASILKTVKPGGLEVPSVIHYLSLDTEGSEYDILCDFPFDTFTILSISVEHNFIEPSRTLIRQLLESKGFYLDVAVEHDDFFLFNDYQKYI